jgi:hypothetical protein
VPKAYSGSFAGTNSFYLDFSDVGTTTAGGANTGYGKDLSGKGTPNNWTTNNFGTTSTLATYDSMYDSPTDYDNSVYGAGNYATFNPLVDWHTNGSNFTFASGNLDISEPAATTYGSVASTIAMTTGKWYCEITPTTVGAAQNTFAGITLTTSAAGYPGQSSTSYSYGATGNKFNNNASSAYGATFAANDIIGVAFDADAGSLTFYKNGQSQLTAFTSIPAGSYYFVVGDFATTQSSAFSGNFGQRPFRGEYVSGSGSSFTGTGAPPTGFKALNTKNITRPTDANMWFYGDTPDLMWIKNRTASSTDHSLTDTVRGVGLGLTTNTTPAVENGAQDVAEMNKFGMTLIGASSRTTAASNNFVYWAWKGGGTSSSNTDGFVTSTVSANVAAGFSIATYTGNGSNSSVGHGLGAAPSMIIVKSRSAATNWTVYHSSVGTGKYLSLNTSANTTTDANFFTSATSTLFSMTGSATSINTNAATYVAYCFAPIAGYSAFGIYTANASPTDGPFCYTGFLPRFVMIKATTNISGNWVIIDTARLTYNQNGTALYPNSSNSEITTAYIDFLSNGFKIRNSSTNMNNTSSDTYIYAAFAEHPFKIARAR